MITNKKVVRTIDFVVVISSLFVIMWAIGFQSPQVIAPTNEYESTESLVLFEIENADKLQIDTDVNFTNPRTYNLNNNLSLNLQPNTYYWKAIGVKESEIRKLTIIDAVVLNIIKKENGYDVVNAGSVVLNVEVYDNESNLLENKNLQPAEKFNSNSTKFIGGQNE